MKTFYSVAIFTFLTVELHQAVAAPARDAQSVMRNHHNDPTANAHGIDEPRRRAESLSEGARKDEEAPLSNLVHLTGPGDTPASHSGPSADSVNAAAPHNDDGPLSNLVHLAGDTPASHSGPSVDSVNAAAPHNDEGPLSNLVHVTGSSDTPASHSGPSAAPKIV